jgi:copper chaperone CopZ
LIEDLSMNVQKVVFAAIAALVVSSAQAVTIEMTVNGLVCGFCAQGIEKTLRKNAATADVLVSLENRLVAVATKPGADIPDEVLHKALQDAGYEVKAIARTDRTLAGLREQMKLKQ